LSDNLTPTRAASIAVERLAGLDPAPPATLLAVEGLAADRAAGNGPGAAVRHGTAPASIKTAAGSATAFTSLTSAPTAR